MHLLKEQGPNKIEDLHNKNLSQKHINKCLPVNMAWFFSCYMKMPLVMPRYRRDYHSMNFFDSS